MEEKALSTTARLVLTESEVNRNRQRGLSARDQAIEEWLHTEVAAAYDELKADPSKALTIEQTREALAEARRRRAAADKKRT